jgi:DNA-binding Lrp family transcriptional regulator
MRSEHNDNGDGNEHADGTWHFLSNHAQVLICIRRDPNARLRDIAPRVGITERAVQRIIADLVASGHLESERIGRRNRYIVNREVAMRHPAQTDREIGELLDLLAGPPTNSTGTSGQ